MIYLNHAGTSWPKPDAVQAAVGHALASSPSSWTSELKAHHLSVCDSFGIEDPTRLLLTPGATSALSLGVTDHPWQPGDRIAIGSMEHHALHRPAQQLAHRGVEVVAIPRAGKHPLDLEALETVLQGGRVRLVAMTAASNVTGELLPVKEITRLAKHYGALSLIDAAQVAGWLPIDAAEYGADLFAFTGHKGPQGPWGIGGLYVAPHVKMNSPLAACEIPKSASLESSPRSEAPCAAMPGYCDTGSVDRAALAGLVAGLEWLAAKSDVDRLSRARQQVEHLSAAALELGGTLHGSPEPETRMPTAAFTFEGLSSTTIAAAMATRDVFVGSGLQCAPLAHESLGTGPDGVLRLSVGPATKAEDIQGAIAVLRSLAW